MKTGRCYKLKRFPTAVPVILALILFAILLLFVFRSCSGTLSEASDGNSNTESIVEKNPDSIAIPGYEILELKANSKKQTLCFPNPPQNVCYFQIFLYLEDGTLLWKSELIEPGDTSDPMLLTQALEKGTYSNAILRYTCYSLDENLTPLNGAETKLTLWVK